MLPIVNKGFIILAVANLVRLQSVTSFQVPRHERPAFSRGVVTMPENLEIIPAVTMTESSETYDPLTLELPNPNLKKRPTLKTWKRKTKHQGRPILHPQDIRCRLCSLLNCYSWCHANANWARMVPGDSILVSPVRCHVSNIHNCPSCCRYPNDPKTP